MCKKERTYDKVRIEVCRNCQGIGMVQPDDEPRPSKCPVCAGSGRIKKTVNIEITIEPYAGSGVIE